MTNYYYLASDQKMGQGNGTLDFIEINEVIPGFDYPVQIEIYNGLEKEWELRALLQYIRNHTESYKVCTVQIAHLISSNHFELKARRKSKVLLHEIVDPMQLLLQEGELLTIKKVPAERSLSLSYCCENKEPDDLKIEGDMGADPFWCNRCGSNLDIKDFPISSQLEEELLSWAAKYGEWIDWDTDKLLPDGIEMEDKFNRRGFALMKKVKQEMGSSYNISFIPSVSARFYDQSENDFSK
ncbi:hypothetical protein [Oceanobacillus sojae]|uniref:Uncharacterized protein n=1 Tax=Oceanobacillus sojae TaxID=582851 RepID=A0A511ZQS3_9BACI|nr:hypothetical protein [Oceanobacillus sojae]GEN89808.1 hypothetical protein OSO01_45470 [Oceanobacillus sojae]